MGLSRGRLIPQCSVLLRRTHGWLQPASSSRWFYTFTTYRDWIQERRIPGLSSLSTGPCVNTCSNATRIGTSGRAMCHLLQVVLTWEAARPEDDVYGLYACAGRFTLHLPVPDHTRTAARGCIDTRLACLHALGECRYTHRTLRIGCR